MRKYKKELKDELVNNLNVELKFDTDKLEDDSYKRHKRINVKKIIKPIIFSLCGIYCFVFLSIAALPIIAFMRVESRVVMYKKDYTINELKAIEEGSFVKLNEIDYPSKEYKVSKVDEEYVDAVSDFSYKLSNQIINKDTAESGENVVFSPLSIYSLLDILSSGISNESDGYEEINNLLKLDYNTRKNNFKKVYENNYFENDNGAMQMSSGVFLNNDYEYNNAFVNELTQKYVEAFQMDFDNAQDVDKMIEWVNNSIQENNAFKYDDLELNEFKQMYAFSNIYFKNKWSQKYYKKENFEDYFYNIDGTRNKITYMNHIYYCNQLYDYGNYMSFYDYYYNDYKIKYIFSKDEKSIFDLINNDNYIIDDNEKQMFNSYGHNNIIINLSIPKFSYECSYDFSSILECIGLKKLFDDNYNTLDNIFKNYSDDTNFYLDFVKQKNKIIFEEDGTTAKSIGFAGAGSNSAAPVDEISIKLNSPFIYIIYDSNNLPIYVGSYLNL